MELGSHSWMDCLAAELFIDSCFSHVVFVTLFPTAGGGLHLLNTVVLTMADGLFGLYGSERSVQLLIDT